MTESRPDDDRNSLDERVNDFYEQQALPYNTLEELRTLIGESSAENNPTPQRYKHYTQWLPIAASVVLLFFVSTLLVQRQTARQQQIQVVAAEIALNHAKQFDPEVTSPSIASLVSEMPLLDFAPVHPKRLQYETYHIDGARYCTIDSAVAVQVHLTDDDQHPLTLYQFRDAPELPLEDEAIVLIDNIQVTIWREANVVMGLAQEIEE